MRGRDCTVSAAVEENDYQFTSHHSMCTPKAGGFFPNMIENRKKNKNKNIAGRGVEWSSHNECLQFYEMASQPDHETRNAKAHASPIVGVLKV